MNELNEKIALSKLTTNMKEITTLYPKYFDNYIKQIQNEIILFCKDANYLQLVETYDSLKITSQFEFSACVDVITTSVTKEIQTFEDAYINCRNNCQIQLNEDLDVILHSYNTKSRFSRKPLPKCVKDCIIVFTATNGLYLDYMVESINV